MNIKRVSNIVLFSTFFTAWLVLLAGCSDQEPGKPKLTKTRAQFSLGKTKFNIERKYIKGAFEDSNKKLNAVNLWALLPNFEAYDKNINDYEFNEVKGWGRRIYLDVSVRGHTAPVNRTLENLLKTDSTIELIEKRQNFEIYTYWTKRDNLFIYKIDNTPVVNMTCSIDGSVSYPGCSGYWDYSDDVVVRFSFSKKYLSDWEKLWKTANEILSSKQAVNTN